MESSAALARVPLLEGGDLCCPTSLFPSTASWGPVIFTLRPVSIDLEPNILPGAAGTWTVVETKMEYAR